MNIDSQRLSEEIEKIATFSSEPAPAVTRVLFSEEDIAARNWLLGLAEDAGFSTRHDPVGDLFITWEGSDPSLPPTAAGSHCDALPNSGKYDGVVGLLGGLEAMRALKASGHQPRRSIELIMFTAAEPTRFEIGCLGSRMLAGDIGPEEVSALRDPDGNSIEDLRPEEYAGELSDVKLPAERYASFVELHIEQGPDLDEQGLDIGIVEKIAAPVAYRLRFEGTGGHAGAVLMQERSDAFLAAAEVALAVEQAAWRSGSPDTVGTTGVVEVKPGVINCIPDEVTMELDFRDTDVGPRDAALARIRSMAEGYCQARGVSLSWECLSNDPPAVCDPDMVALAETAAAKHGYSQRRMISRAYHDSLFMADICPTTMIFIPCDKGYSHRPDEYSSPEAIAKGSAVLAECLRQLSA